MKVSALAGLMLTAGLLGATCACSASASQGPADGTAPARTTSAATAHTATGAAAAGTAASSSTQPTTPQRCQSAGLRIATAPGSGEAMDGVYWDLTFTNTATAACTLFGYPGVSFLTTQREPIDAPATRVAASPRLVTLAPGEVASAQVKTVNIGNQPPGACDHQVAAYVKVYPPDDTVAVYVPAKIALCAGHNPGGSVWPVVAGNHAGV